MQNAVKIFLMAGDNATHYTKERIMKDYSGETVKLKYGSVKIIKRAGPDGGQGAVYRAEVGGKTYGFKILFSNGTDKEIQLRDNIKFLLQKKAEFDRKIGNNKDFRFTFPIEEVVLDDGHEAHLMDWANGKDIYTLIDEGTFDKYTLYEKLEVIRKINEAFWFLSRDNLCYQDINAENIFYDVDLKIATVIDTENTTPAYKVENKTAAFVVGKEFYMAPEVGAKLVNYAAKSSDYYAMAVLYYSILTCSNKSPYHGKVAYENYGLRCASSMDEACESAKEDDILEDFLTFAFDPNNKVNSLESFYLKNKDKLKSESNVKFLHNLKNIIDKWAEVPENLKQLFYKAFADPLNKDCYTRRPLPDSWGRQLQNALNGNKSPVATPAEAELDKTPLAQSPSGRGMYLYNSAGDKIYLTETETVIPKGFLDKKYNGQFGKVEKRGNDYVFVRTSLWGLDAVKGNSYCATSINEIVLEQGMRICLASNNKMFVGVGND